MSIPTLTISKKSVIYLYDYLHAQEAEADTFYDAPAAARPFYTDFLAQGVAVYNK